MIGEITGGAIAFLILLTIIAFLFPSSEPTPNRIIKILIDKKNGQVSFSGNINDFKHLNEKGYLDFNKTKGEQK